MHQATLLRDGRVLVSGGFLDVGSTPATTIEIWNPSTGEFGSGPRLATRRAAHTATLLPDGRVVVIGGDTLGREAIPSVEYVAP